MMYLLITKFVIIIAPFINAQINLKQMNIIQLFEKQVQRPAARVTTEEKTETVRRPNLEK